MGHNHHFLALDFAFVVAVVAVVAVAVAAVAVAAVAAVAVACCYRNNHGG